MVAAVTARKFTPVSRTDGITLYQPPFLLAQPSRGEVMPHERRAAYGSEPVQTFAESPRVAWFKSIIADMLGAGDDRYQRG